MGGQADRGRWTLVAVCATTFMLLVDITIVNVALPSVQRELHASLTGLQWVVDAYAVSLAALILTAGALADRFGRKLVFQLGIALFTVASLLCGVAWNIAALDAARALQGIGGAALFATALALIGAEFQGPARGSAIAIWGATVGLAVAAGPLLGGVITDFLSWRWIFFVNIPVGVFAFALAAREVRESRDAHARRADPAGLVTFSAALVLIVFALLRGNDAGWGSAQILAALVAGAALLVAFVVVEVRQERPMLDVALFPFLSIYLQDVDGYSALGAGLRFLPITAFVFFVPLATRRWAARADLRVLLGGSLAIISIGLALMELLSAGDSWTVLLPGFVVTGIGIGLANPTIAGAALRVVDPSRTGMASGISNTCRITGLAVGVAALGVLLQHRIGTHLAAAGYPGKKLSAAVTSSGLRAAGGNPRLAHTAGIAFVSGLRLIFLGGCLVLLVGAGAALLVRPQRADAREPARAPA